MNKKFKASFGAVISKSQAQVYGQVLDDISKKANGTLKPMDVVEEARDVNNPLHDYFEWDNSKAGERYRVEQARYLIRHITVEIKYDHKVKDQRAFFSVNETPDGDCDGNKNKTYITIERVLSEPNLRKQMLLQALTELEYWRDKYREYRELERVFAVVEKISKKIRTKLTKHRVKKKK